MSIPTPTGFAYRRTEYRYVALYRDGSWQPGGLTTDAVSYTHLTLPTN